MGEHFMPKVARAGELDFCPASLKLWMLSQQALTSAFIQRDSSNSVWLQI